MYKAHFERSVNPTNLAMFINAYIHRTDLNIARTPSGSPQASSKTLKMPVINITGSLSPHADDTVTLNGRLDPTNSSWMKVCFGDSSMNVSTFCIDGFRFFFFFFRFPTVQWFSKNSRENWPKRFVCFYKAKDMVSFEPNINDKIDKKP